MDKIWLIIIHPKMSPPRYLPRHHLRCRRPLGRRAAGAAAVPDPGQWPVKCGAETHREGNRWFHMEKWWFYMDKWWFYMENKVLYGKMMVSHGKMWMLPGKNVFFSLFFEETCGFWYSWPRKIGFWLVFFHLEPSKMVMLSGKLGSLRDELGF